MLSPVNDPVLVQGTVLRCTPLASPALHRCSLGHGVCGAGTDSNAAGVGACGASDDTVMIVLPGGQAWWSWRR